MAFKKNYIPWNKGKKTGIIPKSAFKKGHIPYSKTVAGMGIMKAWNKGMRGLNVGEKSGRWIADRSKIKIGDRLLNDPLQKGWRKAVKNRDGWKCRIADENCSGRLEAHHILPWSEFPELRYEINNGITLCHHHHPRKRVEVMELSPYFQSLVAEVN